MFDDGTRMADLQRQARRAAEAGVLGIVFVPSRYQAEAATQDELFLRSCREAGLAIVLIVDTWRTDYSREQQPRVNVQRVFKHCLAARNQ
jgi:predicted TIM-barrel fold metal-dependent hydrolase